MFDLDGTFADTAPDMAHALNVIRDRQGLTALPLAVVRPYVSHGARGMLDVGFGISPKHETFIALRDAFYDQYQRYLCVDSTLFDGIDVLVDTLEKHNIAWGIVTNKAARFAIPIIDALVDGKRGKHGKRVKRAGCIVCGDTTAHTKPHPAPLLHAAKLIGIAPSNTLYVGDDARDIQAAHAAGMRGVVAAYGYIGVDSDPRHWGAEFSIAAPSELWPLLCHDELA